MKNTQRGFIMPLLLALIAILLVGGGAYVYMQNKQGNQSEVVNQPTDTTSTAQTANWKTYTNNAFGFSIKLPTNNNVYSCEDSSTRAQLANDKSYRVFILENPSDIDLMKSCDYSERAKYNNLYISASRSTPGAYSDLVANWKKGYGDGKYATLEQTTFAGHEALIKTKVEGPNNDNLYKEVVVNGGTYSYDLRFAKKSDSLEKILATFQVIAVKDTLSDWQSLKSNDLGIEIKFPNDYRSNTVNSKLVAASDLTIYPVPQPIEFGPRLVVSRNSDHITANTSVDTYVSNFLDANKSMKERKNVTINGTSWTKVRYLDVSGAGPEMTYVSYFAIKNGYMYTINYNETSQINTGNFEKIIGTITFFQSVSSPTNNQNNATTNGGMPYKGGAGFDSFQSQCNAIVNGGQTLKLGDTDATSGGRVSKLQTLLGIPSSGNYDPRTRALYISRCTADTPDFVPFLGMQMYVDRDFGFAFWYPSAGSVKEITVSNPNAYPGGTVLKELSITANSSGQKFTIEEYNSPDRTITDPVLGCPMGNCSDTTRYYFDVSLGTWMAQYPDGTHTAKGGGSVLSPGAIQPADVSTNTMGGLHMLAGTKHWGGDVIIPLSAHHFLIVSSASQPGTFASGDQNYLANTIIATDPSVATPISPAQQIQTIQAEATAYGI